MLLRDSFFATERSASKCRYNDDVSQWSKGEYPNANNQEDDIAEITAHLGVRPGDVGDTIGTAHVVSPRVFSGVERRIQGFIETRTDIVSVLELL